MARLLVIGSPRSGTRSVAARLREAGLRIGHEKMLRDGTVSGLWTVDDFLYPGAHSKDRPSKHTFDITVHLVRHPLATIASLAALDKPHFWHWTQVHTGRSVETHGKLVYAAHFWSIWNQLARLRFPNLTWRIEDADEWWPETARLFDLDAAVPMSRIGHSEHETLRWSDLGSAEETVRKEAALYGYKE
jgi:hypothetical protein